MHGGKSPVQHQLGYVRQRRRRRHVQAGDTQAVGADGDEERLDGAFAAPQRRDPGRDEVCAGQVLRYLGHWSIAAAAVSTLSRKDAGSIAG